MEVVQDFPLALGGTPYTTQAVWAWKLGGSPWQVRIIPPVQVEQGAVLLAGTALGSSASDYLGRLWGKGAWE